MALDLKGGKVKRTPPRVLTPTTLDDTITRDKNIKKYDIPKKTKLEDAIDDAFQIRDDTVAGLLDLDNKFDAVNAAMQDQIKDMDIPVNNRSLREAVRQLGGDGSTITSPIYNKAKKIAEALGSTAIGLNPLHVPFAKKTPQGKALTQYSGDILKNCADIDWKNFPNAKIYKNDKQKTLPFVPNPTANNLDNDGIGSAGTNEDGSVLTTLDNMMEKAKIDILNFILFKLFWDIIFHKFLLKILMFHPKVLLRVLKKWKDKRIIGRVVKPIYCWLSKTIAWFYEIPTVFGIRPPVIGGDKRIIEDTGVNNLEYESRKSRVKITSSAFSKGGNFFTAKTSQKSTTMPRNLKSFGAQN